ncbi:uncharacterized protein F4822DRAFT_222722 [Hypoxylon trugodes]|uniref:uncharacterized protein n=1 Tax=Hypoxylon trugodes TaxID=326681 RepID=UPI0021982289|nr:uncharacterized protein F4822DRAFT_222722 [Hypoxylon trugodes]KAI1390061.1 hypothetical protein F4822DRAFT_222722 [Hypoxylon trugodes]
MNLWKKVLQIETAGSLSPHKFVLSKVEGLLLLLKQEWQELLPKIENVNEGDRQASGWEQTQRYCPVARNFRRRVQVYFRKQRITLQRAARLGRRDRELFRVVSSILAGGAEEHWKTGIQTIGKIIRRTPNYNIEEIISCLMVADSMRRLGEEKKNKETKLSFVSATQYVSCQFLRHRCSIYAWFFNDFGVWRRLIPAETAPLFDRTSHLIWTDEINDIEYISPCNF